MSGDAIADKIIKHAAGVRLSAPAPSWPDGISTDEGDNSMDENALNDTLLKHDAQIAANSAAIVALERTLERLYKLVPAAVPAVVPVTGLEAYSLPGDAETRHTEPLPPTKDVAEAKRRALFGITWAGNQALSFEELVATHAYIDELQHALIAGDTPAEIKGVTPEVAALAYLTGVAKIPALRSDALLGLASKDAYLPTRWAGFTPESFLAAQWDGGEPGQPVTPEKPGPVVKLTPHPKNQTPTKAQIQAAAAECDAYLSLKLGEKGSEMSSSGDLCKVMLGSSDATQAVINRVALDWVLGSNPATTQKAFAHGDGSIPALAWMKGVVPVHN